MYKNIMAYIYTSKFYIRTRDYRSSHFTSLITLTKRGYSCDIKVKLIISLCRSDNKALAVLQAASISRKFREYLSRD